ncbi:hypothetical protein MBLNU230_g3019t1 [Neophaeotheca triangularis]
MAKRPHADVEDTSRPPKRSKPNQKQPPPEIEEIHFAHQLQTLLTFHQSNPQQLRNGIASFKVFLESILYHREQDDRGRQLSILREYLESQKPSPSKPDAETQTPFLAQLFQGWGFANSNNNDYLASSVSAVLALLVKTLAGLLDLRDYGLLVCRAVLHFQHLRLVKRNLDAPKHKEFVISPALRLLTEVTGFDGGVLAREVYKRREQTFHVSGLRRLLGLGRSGGEEDKRRPSVRTLTVRYILAHLKFQDEGGKIDILRQKPICSGLFSALREDSAEVVMEILATVEQNVLRDQSLPRSAKSSLIGEHNLLRVLEVARDHVGADDKIESTAFAWLRAVCTTPSYGILRASGWYPPGTAKHEPQQSDDTIDLGLDSIPFYDTDAIQLRNIVLSNWLPSLRPQSSSHERDILLGCFKAAPELVAPYFQERAAHMQMEPKLTNTWVGYASFMLEASALPAPPYVGHTEDESFAQLPPQTSIVVESLLPRPLNQKVLTRCINQSSELITFFAMRLLVVSLQKLATILNRFETAKSTAPQPALWSQAAEKLLDAFSQRCPSMSAAIEAFRKIPDDDAHLLQRESAAHLLRLFHEVTPVQALEQQFDVSSALTTALERSDKATPSEIDSEISKVRAQELQHLLSIAKLSNGMRWFDVPKKTSLKLSPIVTLLKLHAREGEHANHERRVFIESILVANDMVNECPEVRKTEDGAKKASATDALVACLVSFGQKFKLTDKTWSSLQDCFGRAAKAPVKYVDIAEKMQRKKGSGATSVNGNKPSVLAAVMHDQRPFVKMREEKDGEDEVSTFTSCFMMALTMYCDEMMGAVDYLDKRSDLVKSLLPQSLEDLITANAQGRSDEASDESETEAKQDNASPVPFDSLPVEPDSHPELLRWTKKDLDLAIEDSDISALMLCLSSADASIRIQAKTQLTHLSNKIFASSHEHKDQLYILVGELLETYTAYTHQFTSEPTATAFPYLATTFAARAIHILLDTTHLLYPKLNAYLMKSPSWHVSKLPTYWLSQTLHSQPSDDDTHWREIQWVLDWLVAGLRTPADSEIFRQGQVFEKLMALYLEPGASGRFVKDKVLEVVWRGGCVDASTLVTRTGVLGWLRVVGGREDGGRQGVVKVLRREILEKADAGRLAEWSGMEVERM